MQWVNDRAATYDTFIKEMGEKFGDVVKVLEEIFVQSSRDRIIDIATKVCDDKSMVSREEFNRIFKVHKKYEGFLNERNLTNGEVDIAYRIITDSYEGHIRNHTFVEDVRGYNEEYRPTDRLFTCTKRYLSHEMIRGCRLSGVKKIRVHDIRHTHASLLIELGFQPLLVSERLGHENIETTLNTYSHLYPNKHGKVAETLSKLMQN